jgi:hypothetical protein
MQSRCTQYSVIVLLLRRRESPRVFRHGHCVPHTITYAGKDLGCGFTGTDYTAGQCQQVCQRAFYLCAPVPASLPIIDLQYLAMVRARSILHACRGGSTCPWWRQGA